MEGDELHAQHRLSGLGEIQHHATPPQTHTVTDNGHCLCSQALYDHLMDFLADRGVDNTFADELMELSTAVEHQEYIKFLEDLQSFVKCN